MDYIMTFLGGVVLALLALWVGKKLGHGEMQDLLKDLQDLRLRIVTLETWKSTVTNMINGHEASLSSLVKSISMFRSQLENQEKSFTQYHNDYILMQTQLAAVDRRYADLSPMHRHYYFATAEKDFYGNQRKSPGDDYPVHSPRSEAVVGDRVSHQDRLRPEKEPWETSNEAINRGGDRAASPSDLAVGFGLPSQEAAARRRRMQERNQSFEKREG